MAITRQHSEVVLGGVVAKLLALFTCVWQTQVQIPLRPVTMQQLWASCSVFTPTVPLCWLKSNKTETLCAWPPYPAWAATKIPNATAERIVPHDDWQNIAAKIIPKKLVGGRGGSCTIDTFRPG